MNKKIEELEKQFKDEASLASDLLQFEALKVKYLGRNGAVNGIFGEMSSLSKEEKASCGKNLNGLKQRISAFLEEKIKNVSGPSQERFDMSFPPYDLDTGSRHILSVVSRQICSIFQRLGFVVAEGTEIEDEWHNFTALNIPLDHPSRDAFDTFYLDIPGDNKYLLRSHTSPSQAHILKTHTPPIAAVSPGRVYRPDSVDASHSFMFHQIEGFAVKEELSFAHLKGVLLHFAGEFFSPGVKLRFRPHFFPFTEPSAEVDVSCIFCASGESSGKKCSVCKGKGWLEILGCGMIHPNVLKSCGINPAKFKGFAFGMGVERMVMLKYGIDDIRLFYENDVRFLKQF